MNLVRAVLGLMGSGLLLIGGVLGWVRRTDPTPQLIITHNDNRGMTVYLADIDDGDLKRVSAENSWDMRLVTVSPDGKWFLYDNLGHVFRKSLASTQGQAIQFPTINIQASSYGYSQWSGDGRWLVLETVDLNMANTFPLQHLYRISMDNLQPERLTQHLPFKPHYVDVFYYATPDQDSVLYFGTSEDVETPTVDLYRVEIATGHETQLTTRNDTEYIEGWYDDWLIYWSSINASLNRVRLDGTDEQLLLPESPNEWLVHEPMDGWLYIGSYRDDLDGGELYRIRWEDVGTDTADTQLQRLTTLEGYERFSFISPDGEWMYFTNDTTLYRMHLDGTALEAIAEGVTFGRLIGWSDDHTSLYYVDGSYNYTVQMSRLVLETSIIEPMGEVYAVPILLSSDHRWLAYARVGDEQRGVTIMETATGQEKLLALPFDDFRLFDWMPRVDREWQGSGILAGGGVSLAASVGLRRLWRRASKRPD